MLSEYQLKIADLYNFPVRNVKKFVPNFFDKEEYKLHYENLQLYLRLELKLCIRIQSSTMVKKPYIEFNTQKENRCRKEWRERWKSYVQINEQCCIWQNDGKLEKKN